MRELVESWLVDEVIGHNLCPFAAAPFWAETVWITVVESTDVDDAIAAVAIELATLAELTEAQRSTTLIACPGFPDWEAFRDVVGGVEDLIEDGGVEEFFQVVGFHPDAVYEGAEADDPANRTARAPVPVVHLLRADAVEKAVREHPDAAGISDRNAARLRSGELG